MDLKNSFYILLIMEFNSEKTSIEYFNDYTRDFVRDIQSTFPEYKDLLGEYYSDILTEESQNTDKHVKRFMRKMSGRPQHEHDQSFVADRTAYAEMIQAKAIFPSKKEVALNPKSRSARLRVLRKLRHPEM